MKQSEQVVIEIIVNRILREHGVLHMSFEVRPPTVEEDCWLISFGDLRMPDIPLGIPLSRLLEAELEHKIGAALAEIGL